MSVVIDVGFWHNYCVNNLEFLRQTDLSTASFHRIPRSDLISLCILFFNPNRMLRLHIHECPHRIGTDNILAVLICHNDITIADGCRKFIRPGLHAYLLEHLRNTADLNIPADCEPGPLMLKHIVNASAYRLGIDVDTILHGIHQTPKRHFSCCINI